MPQCDAYHLNWGANETMSTSVFFDASVHCDRFFSHGFIAESCQQKGFFKRYRLFQDFLPSRTNKKSELVL